MLGLKRVLHRPVETATQSSRSTFFVRDAKAPLNLPTDIVDYVSRSYAEAEIPVVMATLENAKLHDVRDPDFRTFRCALVASDNSVGDFEHLVSGLAIDYRDVIVAGEYTSKEGELVRIRDLALPFPADDK